MIGENIILRALEPEDIGFLYSIENNVDNWEVSETKIPFSKYLLHEYLKNIGDDITKTGQLRLVIQEPKTNMPIGLIDLFDFDAINNKSGVGLIISPEYQNKGIGTEALQLLIKYCKTTLNIHQLYCDIQCTNKNSISFFEKNGFEKTGIKKDWNLVNGSYIDVYFYQAIL